MRALNMAKFIVNYSNLHNQSMTNLRLQKTLYYLFVLFFQQFKKELFDDDFIALDYGPIVREVYEYYKIYGKDEIKERLADNTDLNNEEQEFLGAMLDRLSSYSVYDLVYSTHQYEPWINTPRNEVMPHRDIINFHNRNGITMYRGKR